MTKYILVVLYVLGTYTNTAQNLSGEELLAKAIAYHDPNGNWHTFNGQLAITMQTPKNSDRLSEIELNLPAQYFKLQEKRNAITKTYIIDKKACVLRLNGAETISGADQKKHNLSCDRALTMKNYYTYLYGLPMKLKDPGTHIAPQVQAKTFKGKKYLVLKVTYDENVGSDVWFFYFDPVTYALEVYQFYPEGSEHVDGNPGEYILLSGEETIQGIKMPKTRKWYYNEDDVYLGTDTLSKTES